MPPSRLPGLSKSTFLMGRQCSKLLWFRYNAKDQIPAPDEAAQGVFDQGQEVGELAHQLFPGGTVVAPRHHRSGRSHRRNPKGNAIAPAIV